MVKMRRSTNLSWTLLLFSGLWLDSGLGCLTTDKDPNVPCVFPFTYLGTVYSGCTRANDPDEKLWCATKVDENGSYINHSKQYGYCSEDCPDGDLETDELDIRTVDDEIDETDRQCGNDETCKYQTNCPEFLKQKTHLLSLQRGGQEYKETLLKIRNGICNKAKKAICCPNPKKDDRCERGFSCLKEDQCKYAQDLRKKYRNGDNQAKQELIDLICDRKERKFCCPDDITTGSSSPITASSSSPITTSGSSPITTSKTMSPSWLPGKGKCGVNPFDVPSQILGGVATTPGQFPFTALLGYPNRERKWIEKKRDWFTIDNIKYKCGGTLINHWYVVTAAHCQGSSKRSKISSVRLGEWEVGGDPDCLRKGENDEFCLDPVQDFEISNEQVTVHENYRRTPSNVNNDIALIRLNRPAVLNKGVQIVCLPINPVEAAREVGLTNIRDGLIGKKPMVVGWGYTEYDPWATEKQGDFDKANVASTVQQRLEVPVLSSSECSRKFRSFEPDVTQICAGGEIGKDSCKGDSGGPLYYSKKLDGSEPWYLIGIVSFGSRECGAGQPGVYSRVDSFVPWIRKNIGNK
eukprot:GFUD01017082.1.p1 GENE.GFUD01017082.1~~GFUD01017082.1.p1  ORF type:complete len:578 (-),score=97.32 GFUD01017082.1:48-1781(-)